MRFIISAIILVMLWIFGSFLVQTFPALNIDPSERMTLLAIGGAILGLGTYAVIAVFRRSPYHRTAAFVFFASFTFLVFPIAQKSLIKHAMGFPAIGIIILAIDALIFWA